MFCRRQTHYHPGKTPIKLFPMRHLFSVLIAALATTTALANFVGMEYEVVAETVNGTTYRVYATFDDPTDELVAVYALETAPMVVGVSTEFYQDPVGAVLAQTINPLFFASFPSLEYDSWFTIGSVDSNGTSDVQQVGMDTYFDAFEAGGGFTIDTFIGGSWFLLPGQSSDAEAGADGRVLVGQFTTDGVVTGTLNLQVFSEGVSSDDFMDDVYAITVPEFDASNPLGVEDAVGPLNWTVTRLPFGYVHRLDARGTWERLDVMGRMLESGVTEDGRFQTSGGGFVCFWSECRKRSVRKWIPN